MRSEDAEPSNLVCRVPIVASVKLVHRVAANQRTERPQQASTERGEQSASKPKKKAKAIVPRQVRQLPAFGTVRRHHSGRPRGIEQHHRGNSWRVSIMEHGKLHKISAPTLSEAITVHIRLHYRDEEILDAARHIEQQGIIPSDIIKQHEEEE